MARIRSLGIRGLWVSTSKAEAQAAEGPGLIISFSGGMPCMAWDDLVVLGFRA